MPGAKPPLPHRSSAACALGGFLLFRNTLKKHYRTTFFTATAATLCGLLAVAGHGMYHHGLFPGHFSNSLDFRWKYWVASVGIFKAHPIAGVGWGNFGSNYLAYRLPEAAEEIKDPHNFIIKLLTELGLIGTFLGITWLILAAWEITKPAADFNSTKVAPETAMPAVIKMVLLGMFLNISANVDFSLSTVDTVTLLLKPLLFTLTLLLGTLAGAMRSPRLWNWTLDQPRGSSIFW